MSPIRIETGPMFSSKTTFLLAEIERYQQAGKKIGEEILVFNHANDERYGENVLAAHNGGRIRALAVSNSSELLQFIEFWAEFRQLEAIFIDEAQFFDDQLPQVVEYLDRDLGIEVFLAGLDTDFRGEPFGPMGNLMTLADSVEKHTAICKLKVNGKICGNAATKTQRLINGNPAGYDDPIIQVGAEENYTARCKNHHLVPGKPKLKP